MIRLTEEKTVSNSFSINVIKGDQVNEKNVLEISVDVTQFKLRCKLLFSKLNFKISIKLQRQTLT